MNDHTLVAMFLFAALDSRVAVFDMPEDAIDPADLPVSLYERCGIGAVEAARELLPLASQMLLAFDPEHPFCDLLYSDCDVIAEEIVTYMAATETFPTLITQLELSQCQTLN